MRYSGGIIDWTKEELQDMGRKTRKIMTLNKCLHPRSSVARLYMKWKESKEDMSGALNDNEIEEEETKEEFLKS